MSERTYKREPPQCFACGVWDTDVEASGMWSCPNPFCYRATWFVSKLPSYKNYAHLGEFSVDPVEHQREAQKYMEEKKVRLVIRPKVEP